MDCFSQTAAKNRQSYQVENDWKDAKGNRWFRAGWVQPRLGIEMVFCSDWAKNRSGSGTRQKKLATPKKLLFFDCLPKADFWTYLINFSHSSRIWHVFWPKKYESNLFWQWLGAVIFLLAVKIWLFSRLYFMKFFLCTYREHPYKIKSNVLKVPSGQKCTWR